MFADCNISRTRMRGRILREAFAPFCLREKCGNYISGFQAATDTLGFPTCATRVRYPSNYPSSPPPLPPPLPPGSPLVTALPREKSIFRTYCIDTSVSSVTIRKRLPCNPVVQVRPSERAKSGRVIPLDRCTVSLDSLVREAIL